MILYKDQRIEFLSKQSAQESNDAMWITVQMMPEALIIRKGKKILVQNDAYSAI